MAGTLALPTLVQDVRFNTGQAEQSAKRVEGTLASAGKATQQLDRNMATASRGFNASTLLMAAGTTLVVAGIKKAVDAGASWASTIRGLKATTGGTAEEASKLAFVFERVGVNADSTNRPLATLSRNLDAGGGKLQKYFTTAELATLKTRPLTEILPVLAKRYQELETPIERAAFLNAAFGRGGLELRKVLALTAQDFTRIADEAKKFGLVLTEQNLTDFKKYSEGQRAMSQASKGLQVQVGLLTVPVLQKFNEILVVGLNALASAPSAVRSFAGGIGLLTFGLVSASQGLVSTGQLLGGLTSGFKSYVQTIRETIVLEQALAVSNALLATTGGAAAVAAEAEAGAIASVGTSAVAARIGLGALAGVLRLLPWVAAATGIGLVIKGFVDANREAQELARNVAGIGPPGEQLSRTRTEVARRRAELARLEREAAKAGRQAGADPRPFLRLQQEVGRASRELNTLIKSEADLQEQHAKSTKSSEDRSIAAKREADTLALLGDAVRDTATADREKGAALDKLNHALEQAAPGSEAATQAEIVYAAALADTEIRLAGVAEDSKEAAEIRAKSLQESAKAHQVFREEVLKTAHAETEANAKIIEKNTELILSFDVLRSKAKESLGTLLESTNLNTADFSRFIDDIVTIAEGGAPLFAQKLLEMGPAGFLAARQAAKRTGEGLAELETIAADAVNAAKKEVDLRFAVWPANFKGQAKEALAAFSEGLGRLSETAREKVGAPVELQFDTHAFDDVDAQVARTAQSLNDLGLLKPLIHLSTNEDVVSQSLFRTELEILGLTERQWTVLIDTLLPNLPEAERKLLTAAREREAKIRAKAETAEAERDINNAARDRTVRIKAEFSNIPLTPFAPRQKVGSIVTDSRGRRYRVLEDGSLQPLHTGGLIMHGGGSVPRLHHGGRVPRLHSGGRLRSDERLALLEVDEFVVNKQSTRRHRALLEAINRDRMHSGGVVRAGGSSGPVVHAHFHGPVFGLGGIEEAARLLDQALHRLARSG
jgi:hypothetical protein